jgi:transposase-like protein
VADILIACIDNLKGFPEAIATAYPATEVQTCVVQQIRNSLKYVTSKDQKAFIADLNPSIGPPAKIKQNRNCQIWRKNGGRNIRSSLIHGSATGLSSAPIFSILLLSGS